MSRAARRDGWHLQRDAARVTLSRRLPPQFDLVAETTFPASVGPLRPGTLAHEIRKDLWRRLRGLRGFSPVVEIVRQGDGLTVRAGGQVAGPVSARASERVAAMLDCGNLRSRWVAHARRRGQ